MPNVLVRDLPADVHAELQRRADAQGMSLQQYLTGQLLRLTERPTVEDLMNRIGERRGGRVGLEQAALDIADERARR